MVGLKADLGRVLGFEVPVEEGLLPGESAVFPGGAAVPGLRAVFTAGFGGTGTVTAVGLERRFM